MSKQQSILGKFDRAEQFLSSRNESKCSVGTSEPLELLKQKRDATIFASIIYGLPVIYLMLISAILIQPQVIIWIHLEPFFSFLTKDFQPRGYSYLMNANSEDFADYFFYIHTGSIAIFSSVVVLFTIMVLIFGTRNFFRATLDPKFTGPAIDYSAKGVVRATPSRYNSIKYWMAILFFLSMIIFTLFFPFIMEIGGNKLSPDMFGIGVYIFFWMINIFYFPAGIVMFYGCVRFHWWPKLMSWQRRLKEGETSH